jgi:hypothetical protein
MWIKDNRVIRMPEGITVDEIQHPASIFWLWKKEELAKLGIKPYHPANPPEGFRVTASRLEEVDGEMYERIDVEPLPAPEPLPALIEEPAAP